MSVNYNTSVLNSRLQDVANAIDAGGAPGVLRLLDAVGNVVSSLGFALPCGVVAGGVLTFTVSLLDVAATGGTAVSARCEDSTGTTVISGLTVSAAPGTDIVLSPTNVIGAGQVVAITAASITGN